MITIIVCSINPRRLEALKRNVSETIGDIPYELISFDNREEGKSIAAVYNESASKAQYPYLLFIHEDAGFIDKDWGGKIIPKLKEPDCGVIGFAGSQLMLNAPGGWNVMPKWCIWNLIERGNHNALNVTKSTPEFEKVVAVDGFAMFVRKDVWQSIPFDEKLLTGFHCYDVDFSLSVGAEYQNYVCTDLLLYHESEGNFGKDWAKETQKLYNAKWSKILPRFSPGVSVAENEEIAMEERLHWRFLKAMKRYGIKDNNILYRFNQYPFTFQHLKHWLRVKSKIY